MPEENKVNPEERFRYIGFDVYPGKGKSFWKDEGEKKSFLEKLKHKRKTPGVLERDFSLVHVETFSQLDKIMVIFGSALMILSFFIPWFSVGGQNLNAIGFLTKLSLVLGYSIFSGFSLGLLVILVGLVMILTFVLGILNLIAVLQKSPTEIQFQQKLKKALRLNFFPLVLFGVILLLATIGMPSPFLSGWGIKGLGESFTIVSLIVLSRLGMWLALVGLILNCVKVSDL